MINQATMMEELEQAKQQQDSTDPAAASDEVIDLIAAIELQAQHNFPRHKGRRTMGRGER